MRMYFQDLCSKRGDTPIAGAIQPNPVRKPRTAPERPGCERDERRQDDSQSVDCRKVFGDSPGIEGTGVN